MIYIKALEFIDDELKMNEIPVPEPEDNEVLVKTRLAGVCNTDLEILRGYQGFEGVLGHEFVGTVVEDNKGELKDKRVVGSINIPCNYCAICQQGLYNHCQNIRCLGIINKDGVFAEYFTLPRENIYLLPDQISDQEAVFVEPMAAAVEIIEKIHIRPTDDVVVLGDGKLGLITAMTLWSMGYDIKVVGKHSDKLNILEEMGIETVMLDKFNKRTQVVIDCTGSNSGLETAIKSVQPEGKIILKTTLADNYNINLSKIAVNELQIIGSRCGPFAPTIRLMKRNKLPLKKMIDKIFDFKDGVEALNYAAQKGVMKVLLKFDY
ncbi:MAG: MDR/zinc-dependent alcohol dehydrogenase-like family protein [Halanaerobiales bacterium]